MDFQLWLIYAVAALGLSVSPGPNGLLVLTHGALYGHKRTLVTIAGGVSGFMLIIALSLFGIGALLQTSANALIIMKWAGGGYLVWLGIQLWFTPALEMKSQKMKQRSNRTLFRLGFFAAVSNPKAILFFSAFLTQFIDPNRPLWPQFVILALTFAVTESVYEFLVARSAHQLRPWLAKKGQIFNRVCGGIFAAIGVYLPLSE